MDMEKGEVKLRDARPEDAEFVAWAVLTALDRPLDEIERMTESCADPDSMYSWSRSIIAEKDGKDIGCAVMYSGDEYPAIREYSWGKLWGEGNTDFIRQTALETLPGEYYIDSLAILPEYRGEGLGRLLLEAAIERGKTLGYGKMSLLVSVKKPRLKKYYETMGFTDDGEIEFFGYMYRRMVRSI